MLATVRHIAEKYGIHFETSGATVYLDGVRFANAHRALAVLAVVSAMPRGVV